MEGLMMQRKWIVALVIGITFAASAAQAHNDAKRQCLKDANAERKACTQVCKDEFLADADTCRALNHDCATQAREDRQACVSEVTDALRQCIADSCGHCDGDISQCKRDFPKGSPERDACIDQVQVDRFKCRDTCRESVELFKSLKACRDEFKADINACKLPPPPEPTPQ
jgi:hypothetical protein